MKNNMMSNKSNQSCAFITVTMPDGTMYAGMIPQLGFVDGAVSRTPSIHITAGNAHVLHPTPAIQEKKGAVMDADPTMARVKANEAINVNLTFQNMLDLVTAFSAYHSLDLHVGEMRYEGFWEGILSGLERLGEIICDISPLYKTLEEAREEEKFFEDILWVKKIKLEKKDRMLMGLRNRDDGKGNKNADYTKNVLHVTITYQNMIDLVAAFCAYHRLDLYVGENGKDGFWGDILSELERLGEVICDISPLYKVFEETFEENRIFEDILWVEEIGLEKKARMLMGYSDNEGDSDESTKSHAEAENE